MNFEASSKVKILHMISGDLWAGAEAMAYNLLNRLGDYDDLEISVILLNEGRLASELKGGGLDVHVIEESRHSCPKIFLKIRNFVRCNQPDIIHSHRYKENLLALLASHRRGTKLVSTQHGLPEAYAKRPGIVRRLISNANFFTLSRLFTTVAVSKDIRRALVNRYGLRKDRIEVIHNGIRLPPPNPREKAGPFVIGSSGRLFPVKDYPLMVEVTRVASTTGAKDFRFELAGDGPEMPALESRVKYCKIEDRFIFKGHVDDMDSFYGGLDVYLNTSIHEGIPMTILEAMGHGLPVIAPAVGGIVEIIEDGKEGFLIDSRKPEHFAEKCLLLKENADLRKRMSLAARRKVERCFSSEIMAEKYYRLYRKLID